VVSQRAVAIAATSAGEAAISASGRFDRRARCERWFLRGAWRQVLLAGGALRFSAALFAHRQPST